jgi:hypothetical protein
MTVDARGTHALAGRQPKVAYFGQRVGVDLPQSAARRAHGPSSHGPDRSRPRATVRNNAASGQLVGRWTRMRAMRSITRAPILIRRSRIVANSAVASGLVRGIAARKLPGKTVWVSSGPWGSALHYEHCISGIGLPRQPFSR